MTPRMAATGLWFDIGVKMVVLGLIRSLFRMVLDLGHERGVHAPCPSCSIVLSCFSITSHRRFGTARVRAFHGVSGFWVHLVLF
jgi:hypothetical protein